MRVYVVVFYGRYEGYSFDKKCKAFKDRLKAEIYIKKLNKEIANGCAVEGMLGYYDYKEIDLM